MALLQDKPFIRQHLEKNDDVFTIRLNPHERARFNEDKRLINQKKDSTALKQLARIGSIVIHDKKIAEILETLFKNKAKNKRTGIMDFEDD